MAGGTVVSSRPEVPQNGLCWQPMNRQKIALYLCERSLRCATSDKGLVTIHGEGEGYKTGVGVG